jgi:hypothetical protein
LLKLEKKKKEKRKFDLGSPQLVVACHNVVIENRALPNQLAYLKLS